MATRIKSAHPLLFPAVQRRNFAGYSLATLIGIAPVLTMLLSWTEPGAPISPGIRLFKTLALPVLGVEMLIIVIAFLGSGRWVPSSLPRRYSLAAGAFVLLMIGTAAFAATNPAAAFMRTILWFVHAAFAWSIFRLCERSILNKAMLATALMTGFAIICVLLIIFAAEAASHPGFRWLYDLPGLDNIRRGAYFAAPIAGLCIARFSSRNGDRPAFDLAVYILTISYIFWSGSRGAAVAIGAAYIAAAILIPRLRDLKLLATTLAASVVGIILAWAGSILTGYNQFWRLLPAQPGGAPTQGEDPSSGRIELWTSTWETILQRPFLGHGENQTAYAVPVGEATVAFHPHNLALQLLLAWGLVGTLLLLYIAAPLARRALANARSGGSDCLAPFMAMLILFLYSAVDGTLFHVHAVSIFAICAGMISDSSTAAPKP